jgi:hypothetical protein
LTSWIKDAKKAKVVNRWSYHTLLALFWFYWAEYAHNVAVREGSEFAAGFTALLIFVTSVWAVVAILRGVACWFLLKRDNETHTVLYSQFRAKRENPSISSEVIREVPVKTIVTLGYEDEVVK